ncbi:MAG: Ycf66 family protein [Jaaginema sp. PMC 1079.18]|nr:Ycf66 family protein [Jaaginema sp. PMC 1080.18]MEC4852137.1 Ycf66 family protein [Jaaginema sp. PMC 1079.18]MEC4866855.1 Ycf66 family protein [Jaaginema sp. PMC 1078.18]
MLVYALAIAVALGSFVFFMAAFFFPEVHRRNDFIWSGVGLFYALVLWLSAERITGGVLLGQAASIALLGWLGWQTLSLRRAQAPTAAKTEISEADLAQKKNSLLGGITGLFRKQKPQPTSKTKPEAVAELVEEDPLDNQPEAETPLEEVVSSPEIAPPEPLTTPSETIPDTTDTTADSNWPDDEEDSNWADEEAADNPTVEIVVETPAMPTDELTVTPPTEPTVEMQENAQTQPQAPDIPIAEVAPEAELAPPAEDPGSHDAPMPSETSDREPPPQS